MQFDIAPQAGIRRGEISLPDNVRLELGVLVGQFLQIKAGSSELVLRITWPRSLSQELALVSELDYREVEGQPLQYNILEVTLGCDPEFFIFWNERRISAATYLPFAGEIGSDGELGELRPMYGRHESQVVANLAHLIPQIPHKLKRSAWATGFPENGRSFKYEAHSYLGNVAAGFHVHLGIPPEILNTRQDFNRAALNHMVQCLDWYVSVPLVPLEVRHERRTGRSAYGKPGDYRPSNVTLEYRTPGAFYLRSPRLASGLLGLSLLLVENIVSRLKVASQGFTNLHRLSPSDLHEIMPKPDPNKIREVLVHPNTSVARKEMDGIRSAVQGLPSYGKHREAVDGLFRAVDEGYKPEANLLLNWKERT